MTPYNEDRAQELLRSVLRYRLETDDGSTAWDEAVARILASLTAVYERGEDGAAGSGCDVVRARVSCTA